VSKLTEWVEGLSLSTGGRKLVGKAGIVPVGPSPVKVDTFSCGYAVSVMVADACS
jgi:hypothetical protein